MLDPRIIAQILGIKFLIIVILFFVGHGIQDSTNTLTIFIVSFSSGFIIFIIVVVSATFFLVRRRHRRNGTVTFMAMIIILHYNSTVLHFRIMKIHIILQL